MSALEQDLIQESPMSPGDPQPHGGDPLPPEFLRRLRQEDPDAWRRLLGHVLPHALRLVHDALAGTPTPPGVDWRADQVHRWQGEDDLATQGALWSAWPSFQKHFLLREFADAQTAEELAVHLIRIACNRCQRQHRDDERLRRQAERGAARSPEDSPGLLADAPGRGPTPAEEVLYRDLDAYYRQVVDKVVGALSDRDRTIVRLTLAGRGQEEAAREVGCHQTTVCRVVQRFYDAVRRELDGEP
jgi:DNA-directed RNA polymerase specialized sigma24 family protein